MSTPLLPSAAEFRCEWVALHADARGRVFEPIAAVELTAQRNAHVVLTEPGGIRGNHVHQRGTEITVVMGLCLVRVRLAEGARDFVVPLGEAWRFVIPPGVAHAFKNISDRPQLMVAFNTEVYDPAQPDVVRMVLIDS